MEKIKVAAYCRVSTNSKDQDNSFENQKDYFLEKISKSETEELFDIYADKGTSGTSLRRRDEFKRMLYDAGIDEGEDLGKKVYAVSKKRKPLFTKIYVKNTSRFARDVGIIDILRELLKNGVFVQFLDINLIFDSAEKEFMLNLFLNFDQQESIDKSKKVKWGLERSADKNRIKTSGDIFGYKYHPETNSLEIKENEAQIVRKIFELYNEGYGYRRIINYLRDNDIQSPKGRAEFSISMIKRILGNEKYYGVNVRNKYDSGTVFNKNTYPKIKDEDEWVIKLNGRIPAIVDEETFIKSKEIKKGKVSHITQKGIYKGVSEYAGLIYCDKCGSSYTRNIDRGRVFYNCSNKKMNGISACDNLNIPQSIIDKAIERVMSKGIKEMFEKDKEMTIQVLTEVVRKKIEASIDKDNEEQVILLTDRINELENKKNLAAEMLMDGKISKDYLNKRIDEIDTEMLPLINEVKGLSKTNEEIYAELNEFDNIINDIRSTQINDVATKEDVLKLLRFRVQPVPKNPTKPGVLVIFRYDDEIKKLASKYKILNGINHGMVMA